jgi:hypothetical protein
MIADKAGVLLVDWENLSGAIMNRGYLPEAQHVTDVWKYAQEVCGGELQQAHVAAAKFDPSIEQRMNEHFIKAHRVESTKEQADIVLTVLAMDHLHDGCRKFVLVTGDQDFTPLITRLRDESAMVTVVYGDRDKLSPVLSRALTAPGLNSSDISEISALRARKKSLGCGDLIGLLELQRQGFILGGPEKGDRCSLLCRWGILENEDETGYWSLIDSLGSKVLRKNAAVRAGDQWKPEDRWRTYVGVDATRMEDVIAVDYIARVLSVRRDGMSVANLRSGPMQFDDGSRLDKAIDALIAIQLMRKNANGTYGLIGDDMRLGYLEELWRIHAAVSAECYRIGEPSFRAGKLENLILNGGLGQGREQREAGRIKRAVRYASAAGVIDFIGVDGARHVMATNSLLVRPFDSGYIALYRELMDRVGESIPRGQVLDMMRRVDSARSEPVFGYDDKDRDRLLRILTQSRLTRLKDDALTLYQSKWAETIAASRRP